MALVFFLFLVSEEEAHSRMTTTVDPKWEFLIFCLDPT
jgi:hypothetical protein